MGKPVLPIKKSTKKSEKDRGDLVAVWRRWRRQAFDVESRLHCVDVSEPASNSTLLVMSAVLSTAAVAEATTAAVALDCAPHCYQLQCSPLPTVEQLPLNGSRRMTVYTRT